jgi:hypothetical protein
VVEVTVTGNWLPSRLTLRSVMFEISDFAMYASM